MIHGTEGVKVEAASAYTYTMSNQSGRRVGPRPCHACVQVEAVLLHLAAQKATEHRQAVVCLYTPINGATVAPARC